jgi:hypothetical protein
LWYNAHILQTIKHVRPKYDVNTSGTDVLTSSFKKSCSKAFYHYNCRAYSISEKCNGPDWIRSRIRYSVVRQCNTSWAKGLFCLFDGVEHHFQQYFSYIVPVSFIVGGNRRTRRKTSDLSQVTDKLYHIMLYTSPLSRFELTTSVVICTDCQLSYDHGHSAIWPKGDITTIHST